MPSNKQHLANRLRKALLKNGAMAHALYEYELEEHLDYWYEGLKRDNNEFVFVVTENSGDVASVLIDQDKTVYINEEAREKLKKLWPEVYEENIEKLIPQMVRDLTNDIIFVAGVTTIDPSKHKKRKHSWNWKG
jgi:hypothetical protein